MFTLFGTREVMGKGRVYVYPLIHGFKKIKEPPRLSLGPEVRRKNQSTGSKILLPLMVGSLSGSFLRTVGSLKKYFKFPKPRVLSILPKLKNRRVLDSLILLKARTGVWFFDFGNENFFNEKFCQNAK
jgi:hypothetical protein